jgi:hypothetical protein
MIEPNSNAFETDILKCFSCVLAPAVIPYIYWLTRNVFSVPKNSFALVKSYTG